MPLVWTVARVDFKARVNDIPNPLSDQLFVVLLDDHDSLNLLLALLESSVHILVVLLHTFNQCIELVLALHHLGELTSLDPLVQLLLVLLVALVMLLPEVRLSPLEH